MIEIFVESQHWASFSGNSCVLIPIILTDGTEIYCYTILIPHCCFWESGQAIKELWKEILTCTIMYLCTSYEVPKKNMWHRLIGSPQLCIIFLFFSSQVPLENSTPASSEACAAKKWDTSEDLTKCSYLRCDRWQAVPLPHLWLWQVANSAPFSSVTVSWQCSFLMFDRWQAVLSHVNTQWRFNKTSISFSLLQQGTV